jgi:hypothetical protein
VRNCRPGSARVGIAGGSRCRSPAGSKADPRSVALRGWPQPAREPAPPAATDFVLGLRRWLGRGGPGPGCPAPALARRWSALALAQRRSGSQGTARPGCGDSGRGRRRRLARCGGERRRPVGASISGPLPRASRFSRAPPAARRRRGRPRSRRRTRALGRRRARRRRSGIAAPTTRRRVARRAPFRRPARHHRWDAARCRAGSDGALQRPTPPRPAGARARPAQLRRAAMARGGVAASARRPAGAAPGSRLAHRELRCRRSQRCGQHVNSAGARPSAAPRGYLRALCTGDARATARRREQRLARAVSCRSGSARSAGAAPAGSAPWTIASGAAGALQLARALTDRHLHRAACSLHRFRDAGRARRHALGVLSSRTLGHPGT